MRQLVAVVLPDEITYFLDDGAHHVTQLAVITNRDMDIARVIELGANLADVLGVNGPAPAPAAPRAPCAAATPATKKGKRIRQVGSYGVTAEALLADIRGNPGTIAKESAMRLLGSTGTAHAGAITRRGHELATAGLITFGERRPGEHQGRPARAYFPVDTPSGASEPAPAEFETGGQPVDGQSASIL